MTNNPAVPITNLPAAPSVDATDVFPIVHGGQTMKATITQALGAAGSAPAAAEYVVLSVNAGLSAERVLAANGGISLVDAGAGSTITVTTIGNLSALSSLITTGLIARTGAGTVEARSITTTSAGLSIVNGDGVSGNVAVDVAGSLLSLQNLSGTGYVRATSPGVYTLSAFGPGTGDVSGPGSSVVGQVALWADTTGTLLSASSALNGITIGLTTAAAIVGTTITADTRFIGSEVRATAAAGLGLANNTGTVVATAGPSGADSFVVSGAFAASPASKNVVLSPTGTGVVTIAPATAGTLNNMIIGGTTPLAGTFTALTATAAVALSPANANVVISPTGTGTVTVAPATAGTLNNLSIGQSTRAAGSFTALNANGGTTLSPASAGADVLTVNGNYVGSGTVALQKWNRTSGAAVQAAMIYDDSLTAFKFGMNTSHQFFFINGGTSYGQLSSGGDWSFGGIQGAESLRVSVVASAVNRIQIAGGTAGQGQAYVYVDGSGTNISTGFYTKGTGAHSFYTSGFGSGIEQVRITNTSSANRYLTLTGSNGGNPVIGTSAGALALSPTQVIVASATATPAGGTTGTGLAFGTTSNLGIFFGSGAPTLSAAKGSLYIRTDGSTTNDRSYINTDGGTTWTALITAA